MYSDEINGKLSRVRSFLDATGLDGVLLQSRANFAWVTGGRDNHIVLESETGVASILATRDRLLCLTTAIEAPRFRKEELTDLGIEVVEYPWWDSAATVKIVKDAIGGRKVASDVGSFGLPALGSDFAQVRWQLTDLEIQRYRYCGQLAIAALESVCRQVKPGESEFDIAAKLEFEVQRTGASPNVILVSTDQRVFDYRHPIPTAKKLKRYAMLVVCANYRGLIANCTRFIHFGSITADLKAKQQAVCNVDAAVNLATRPGRTLGEIFADLQAAYATNGYPNEWHLHHQGGSTGYAGREAFGNPASRVKVLANQAFAWNPSIQGTKSEDTVLVTDAGLEILTQSSDGWPKITGRCPLGELARPDILVR